jgi:two-component system sensor histidine kinase KdpD
MFYALRAQRALALVLVIARGHLTRTSDVLAFLLAVLGAVSHDVRTPLAAARAAVSCLRSYELPLTAEDHDDLLATVDESLNLLTHLAAGLLDMARRSSDCMTRAAASGSGSRCPAA